ncbi:MAG: hypothetical protein ACLSAF_06950 [Intestinimonas sp.]
MLKYLAKRIGRSLITLFFIISLVFCLMRQMPVEGYFTNYDKLTAAQVQAGIAQLGLDKPPARPARPVLPGRPAGRLGGVPHLPHQCAGDHHSG